MNGDDVPGTVDNWDGFVGLSANTKDYLRNAGKHLARQVGDWHSQ